MGTLVHPLTQQYANDCAALPDYPSSVNSGIAGNSAHYEDNTYHIAVHHLPNKGGYTNYWPKDKVGAPEEQYAVAVDQSMSTPDMVKEWGRFEVVFYDHTDPRRPAVAEYIGWNGKGKAERLDFNDGSRDIASDDHRWHSHEAGNREDVADPASYAKRLSIRRGETKQQYLASIGQVPSVAPTTGGRMFAVVQVGTGAGVWLAERSVSSDGKVYAALTPITKEGDAKALIAMGADNSKANPVYGDPAAITFASEAEMQRVVFLGAANAPAKTK